jgi:hypothetical protein
MDVHSGRGIGADWYRLAALDASDVDFWAWLTERFDTT